MVINKLLGGMILQAVTIHYYPKNNIGLIGIELQFIAYTVIIPYEIPI